MAFEWVAGLFQTEQTRGLSGDTAYTVALDDANPYYNYRLRRHRADGDIVGDHNLLWFTSPYVKRRSGLGTHVAAEVGEGVANYTDVLLILSAEDHARIDATWQAAVERALQQEFENFCRRESFSRLHAHRQLGFRILCDGSEQMGGQSLGLSAGEFVTGLLPNLYTGPVRGSFPVIGVNVNLPGVWEGYQEVGRLYNDQILFTLGNHWLDNYRHPGLEQAALYRLRQYSDGSFVHIINPDLQDRYQVTTANQGGASVLTLATRAGKPLAYIVLAVIDPPPTRPSMAPGLTDTPAPVGRSPGPRPGPSSPSVPSIAPPMMLDDGELGGGAAGDLGGKTIIPDAPSDRIFTLQERGALLQKVHFSAFMLGYDVYLGRRGELGTHVEDPAATFQVRKRSVSLVAHIEGVKVGGRPVPADVEVPIEGDMRIEVAGQRLEYRDLRDQRVEGWPYVGEIRRPASSTYMIWGEDYQVGRSRECRVVLPDEPRNENIHWKPSVGDGATIRARKGEIPKSRFYTDSIMVASEHATVDLRAAIPEVICQARHCYVFVRRNGEVLPLFPASSGRQPQRSALQPGDEVMIGNCLFHVGFTPAGEATKTAPAPKVDLSADSLADAVGAPDLSRLDRSPAPAERRTPTDPPPATPVPDIAPPALVDDDEVLGLGAPSLPPMDAPPPAPLPPPPPPVDDADDADDSEEDDLSDHAEPSDGFDDPDLSVHGDEVEEEATTRVNRLPEPRDPDKRLRRHTPPLDSHHPPAIDDAEDDPTHPGMILPSEGFDDLRGADLSAVSRPDITDEISLDAPAADSRDVAGWEDAEWPEDDSAPSMPSVPDDDLPGGPPSSVPPPFPEVEAEETELASGDDDDDDVEPQQTVEADPAEAPPPAPVPQEEPEDTVRDLEPVTPSDEVVFTDDNEAQFELGRPMHLIQSGWMVNGEVVCGNHLDADLVLPENRIHEEQVFARRDYFRLKVRGKRGKLTVLSPSEVLIDDGDSTETVYDDPADHVIDVIRRDDDGEEDFAVRLSLVADKALPDPRARLVALDYDDPLAAALVIRGLPKGADRTLTIDGVDLTLHFDGEKVTVSDYLDTYRRGEGFHPFFVQRDGGRFVTAPEDGSAFEVSSGDRLVVGISVFVLRQE
jgi:hypothetical protein